MRSFELLKAASHRHAVRSLVYGCQGPGQAVLAELEESRCPIAHLPGAQLHHETCNECCAGLLYVGDNRREPGVRKSLLLLAGRLLITGLFVYVGWVQMYRVMMRDWALWSKLEYDSMWRKDGHVSPTL